MSKMKDNKIDQEQYLFGDADLVFNALSGEVTIIKEEINKAYATINRKETEIKSLEERKDKLEKAMKIAKKSINNP